MERCNLWKTGFCGDCEKDPQYCDEFQAYAESEEEDVGLFDDYEFIDEFIENKTPVLITIGFSGKYRPLGIIQGYNMTWIKLERYDDVEGLQRGEKKPTGIEIIRLSTITSIRDASDIFLDN